MKSKRIGGKIIYNIPVADATEVDSICDDFTEWTSFQEFERSFGMVHTTFEYPITPENWAFASCDCCDGFKKILCEYIVGVALRLKVVAAPAEAKSIPLGQKRKEGLCPIFFCKVE